MELQETPTENQNIVLDKKSKILFVIIGLLIVGSVAVTYWRYMVERDYIVQAQTDCDPEVENCFIWECDPDSTEEGEACTGDEEEDIWYYKIIRRNAKNIPLCDPNNEECTALVCEENEAECSEELCAEDNVPEGEYCNDPEQYLLENPPDDEECAEDDKDCLAEMEAVECEEADEECLAEQETVECEEGDEECAAGKESTGEENTEECAPEDEDCESEEEAGSDETVDESEATDGEVDPAIQPM